MIICSCAVISSEDIERAVGWMTAADPQVVITPGKVYRALGKKPTCGGCLQLFVKAAYSAKPASAIPAELLGLRQQRKGQASNEGRRKGHRVSQPGAAQRADRDQPVLAALPAAE